MAIKTAIQNSIQDEIIIIAGKGHENTQDYGKKIYKISDKQIINSVKNSFKDNTKRKTDENFAKKRFFKFLLKKNCLLNSMEYP